MIRPLPPVLLAGLAMTPALAAGPLQMTTTMLVERPTVAADGASSSTLVTPARVVPGETVRIVLAYRNAGAAPLGDVMLASPVPRGMRYRGAAPGAAAPDLSVDGTRFAASPASLRVALSTGGTRAATTADITAVRWRLATLPAGAAGQLSFRATLD